MNFKITNHSIYIKTIYMKKMTLSRSMPFVKYLMGVITLFCIYVIIMYHNDRTTIISAGIFGIISFIVAYRSYYASTVEFDDQNMYVSNKRGDDVIPMKNITSFRLTSMQVNNQHFWEIQYVDDINDVQTLKFLPLSRNLDSFIDKVKVQNSNVDIKDSIGFFG